MDKSREQRRHKRVEVVIPVNVNGKNFLQFKKSCDLSVGGMFIKTDLLEEQGTIINIDFLFEEDWEKVKVLGEVVWVSTSKYRSGMGIKFINPPINFIRKIEKTYLK